MKRVFVALLVILSVTTVAGAVPDARLTVSDVTVAPEAPLVDERFTVTATVQNSGGSASAVDVDRVVLRGPDGQLDTAENVGALSAGDSVTVPLTARFDTPGVRTLELLVVGSDENNNDVRITRPVPVAVERAAPQVELDLSDPAVDAETQVQLTVSNPAKTPVRNLVATFTDEGDLGEPVVGRATVPLLEAGETTTLNLTTVPTAAGLREVGVSLDYTTDAGTENSTTFTRSVRVDRYVADAGIEVRPYVPEDDSGQADVGDIQGLLTGGGGIGGGVGGGVTEGSQDGQSGQADPSRIEVVVTNFGSVPLDDIVVAASAANTSLPRQSVSGPLLPGEEATAVVDLRDVRTTEQVTVGVSYTAGVRTERSETTYTYRPEVGDIRITDVDLVRDDDGVVTVSANAVNVGRAEVTGLVVEVVDTDGVEPRYPQRDYFVGTVGGSDFAPFDLTARVNSTAETVPVRVTYQVDGVPYDRVYDLPYEGGSQNRSRIGLPGSTTLGAGVALLVAIPALVVLAARSGRFRR